MRYTKHRAYSENQEAVPMIQIFGTNKNFDCKTAAVEATVGMAQKVWEGWK